MRAKVELNATSSVLTNFACFHSCLAECIEVTFPAGTVKFNGEVAEEGEKHLISRGMVEVVTPS